MSKKKYLLPTIGAMVLVASITVGQVRAQESSSGALAQTIAQKFGLDKTQVQSAIDQFRQTKFSTRQQRMKEAKLKRLDTLVSLGKITSEQKDAILVQQAKLESQHPSDSFKNMTPEERKKVFQAERAEIGAWAKIQGLDPRYVHMGLGLERGKFGPRAADRKFDWM